MKKVIQLRQNVNREKTHKSQIEKNIGNQYEKNNEFSSIISQKDLNVEEDINLLRNSL